MKRNPYIDRTEYRAQLARMGYKPPAGPLRQCAAALALTTTLLIASLITVGTTSWALLALTLAAFAWALAAAGVLLHHRERAHPSRRKH